MTRARKRCHRRICWMILWTFLRSLRPRARISKMRRLRKSPSLESRRSRKTTSTATKIRALMMMAQSTTSPGRLRMSRPMRMSKSPTRASRILSTYKVGRGRRLRRTSRPKLSKTRPRYKDLGTRVRWVRLLRSSSLGPMTRAKMTSR